MCVSVLVLHAVLCMLTLCLIPTSMLALRLLTPIGANVFRCGKVGGTICPPYWLTAMCSHVIYLHLHCLLKLHLCQPLLANSKSYLFWFILLQNPTTQRMCYVIRLTLTASNCVDAPRQWNADC